MWSRDTGGFMLFGVGLMAAAAIVAGYTIRWVRRSKTAIGTVIRVELSVDSENGSKSYYPVIAFTTESGTRQQFRSSVGSNATVWDEGDQTRIRYDPLKPGRAAVDRLVYLYLIPIVLGCTGLVFATIAGYFHFSGKQL